MVMYTGLWNNPSKLFFNDNDNHNDNNDRNNNRDHHRGERRQILGKDETGTSNQEHDYTYDHHHHPQNNNNNKNNNNNNRPPRTIEYGSVFEQAAKLLPASSSSPLSSSFRAATTATATAPSTTTTDDNKTVTWDNDNYKKNKNVVYWNNTSRHGKGSSPKGSSPTTTTTTNYQTNLNYNDDGDKQDIASLSGDNDHNINTFTGDGNGDGGGRSITTSTSTTMEQEMPSLTAAFQSLENRPIIRNCLWYLAIYLSLAVIAYSYIFERWTIIDSLYFAVATFTTCGYSDKEPTTVQGQLFTIIFAIYGVIILGVFIGIFGSFISEAQTKAMKRFQRKKQHQMMETLFNKSNTRGDSERPREEDIEKSGFWRDHVSLADDIWKVVMAEFPLIGLVAVMALLLGMREGWSVTSTLYFCIMAATTTGYGNYTPQSQMDKLYCVILLPLAVAVFGEVLGRIATVYIQRKQRAAQFKFVHRSLTMCDIRNMDTNDDGKVDREDFIFFMLVALQKIDKSTIDELKRIFDSLDTNGNGLLEEDDLFELAEENYVPTLERIQQEYYTSGDMDKFLQEEEELQPNKESIPSMPSTLSETPQRQHRRFHTVL